MAAKYKLQEVNSRLECKKCLQTYLQVTVGKSWQLFTSKKHYGIDQYLCLKGIRKNRLENPAQAICLLYYIFNIGLRSVSVKGKETKLKIKYPNMKNEYRYVKYLYRDRNIRSMCACACVVDIKATPILSFSSFWLHHTFLKTDGNHSASRFKVAFMTTPPPPPHTHAQNVQLQCILR